MFDEDPHDDSFHMPLRWRFFILGQSLLCFGGLAAGVYWLRGVDRGLTELKVAIRNDSSRMADIELRVSRLEAEVASTRDSTREWTFAEAVNRARGLAEQRIREGDLVKSDRLSPERRQQLMAQAEAAKGQPPESVLPLARQLKDYGMEKVAAGLIVSASLSDNRLRPLFELGWEKQRAFRTPEDLYRIAARVIDVDGQKLVNCRAILPAVIKSTGYDQAEDRGGAVRGILELVFQSPVEQFRRAD